MINVLMAIFGGAFWFLFPKPNMSGRLKRGDALPWDWGSRNSYEKKRLGMYR